MLLQNISKSVLMRKQKALKGSINMYICIKLMNYTFEIRSGDVTKKLIEGNANYFIRTAQHKT